MQINEIKVNGYGNLQDTEINLNDGINIIKGKNETGKSTLLNFITSMFYGISKNKDGREISDYEKYKPWNEKEFSGKIKYTLDNKTKYEIFRDFNKKNPKVYNENSEDISHEFEIDKREGNKFFFIQTNIDKQIYTSSLISMQQELKLESQEQNILVQRIANLAGTGEDSVSYKKAEDKLRNKIKEEIGTSKTAQKPINVLQSEINRINAELTQIQPYKIAQFEITNKKEELEIQIREEENKKQLLKELNNIEEENTILNEKIKINENNIKNNLININAINNKKINSEKNKQEIIEEKNKINEEIEKTKQKNIEKEKDKREKVIKIKTKKYIIFIFILFIINILNFIFIKNQIVNYTILGVPLFVLVILYMLELNKVKKLRKEQNREIEQVKSEEKELTDKLEKELEEKMKKEQEQDNIISTIRGQILSLEEANKNAEEEINKIKLEKNIREKDKKEKLKEEYLDKIDNETLKYLLEKNNLKIEIENIENIINNKKLNLHRLEIEENTIMPQLEEIINLEEKLENLNEEYTELKEKEEIIIMAHEFLSKAYEKMKTTITPKFTQNLSDNINKITEGKYTKVIINDEKGLLVEKKDGEYIEANRLSIGTIDQLYLSLRLSMVKEISEERMPIMLDEAFAYFDNDRLENFLKYITYALEENQKIIFTCTNREQEILEKLGIKYNLIELN